MDGPLHREHWRIVVDRSSGLDTTIYDGSDIESVAIRIGQMVLSVGIEQIVVYRNGEEYRRYELKHDRRRETEEVFGLDRCWLLADSPREQTISQNMAEQQFDRYIEQIKRAGCIVSPVKRSLRTIKNDDGVDYMAQYFQRVKVIGPEETIQQLKATLKR